MALRGHPTHGNPSSFEIRADQKSNAVIVGHQSRLVIEMADGMGLEKQYPDPRWCTFKQAQKKDWHIKKGEKGISPSAVRYRRSQALKKLKSILGDNA